MPFTASNTAAWTRAVNRPTFNDGELATSGYRETQGWTDRLAETPPVGWLHWAENVALALILSTNDHGRWPKKIETIRKGAERRLVREPVRFLCAYNSLLRGSSNTPRQ